MELWKETTNKVYLEGDATWSVSAAYAKDGVSAGSIAASWNTTDLRWQASLPYILDECTVTVTWTFTVPSSGQIVKTDSYEIITPLLTKREIQAIWDDATDVEIVEIEAAVRNIIQAHTGQVFGKRNKSVVVVGTGETALALPERLMTLVGLSTLSAVLNPSSAIVIADGWYVKKRYDEVISTIDYTNSYWQSTDSEDLGHGEVISPPGRFNEAKWRDDYPFTINGTWGYSEVPAAVKEAAKLLINDYACSEQSYRDRYLDSIKAADWRLQYNDKAFLHTGNQRADYLLNDYIMKRGWGII